jgi:hypothetical protein
MNYKNNVYKIYLIEISHLHLQIHVHLLDSLILNIIIIFFYYLHYSKY